MSEAPRPIIIKRPKKVAAGHHGGAWKVAYADFVTAMMAFFLVMWLVGTLPEEQLSGIAEYFKNPSIVSGTSRLPPPNAMGPGGAGTNAIKISQAMTAPESSGDGEKSEHSIDSESEDAEELQKRLENAEREQLESLKEDLEAAIKNSQALAPFKDQLLLDITSEGLRIQIVDEQNRPMFDLGSAALKDYTSKILSELATHINRVPNRISISGHTDTTPYSGARDYSNWELSADRANAARRALIAGGMEVDKAARVVGLSSIVLYDKANPTNPINRRISIVVMNKRTDEAMTDPQGAAHEGTDADADADAGANANANAEDPMIDLPAVVVPIYAIGKSDAAR
jgi:chemotaxis protein MotB